MSHHVHRRSTDEHDVVERPPGMTQEQLDFFTVQTERAATKAAREGARQIRNRAVVGFLILLIGIIVAQGIGNRTSDQERETIVESGQAVAVDGCNRDYAENVRIRDVFRTSRAIINRRLSAGESPDPKADKAALAFYDEQLAAFTLPDCRRADRLLTSNPDKKIPVIDPWYEENPNAPKSTVNEGG